MQSFEMFRPFFTQWNSEAVAINAACTRRPRRVRRLYPSMKSLFSSAVLWWKVWRASRPPMPPSHASHSRSLSGVLLFLFTKLRPSFCRLTRWKRHECWNRRGRQISLQLPPTFSPNILLQRARPVSVGWSQRYAVFTETAKKGVSEVCACVGVLLINTGWTHLTSDPLYGTRVRWTGENSDRSPETFRLPANW